MVTIVEPSFRPYGCLSSNEMALRRPSESEPKLGSGELFGSSTPFEVNLAEISM